MTTPVSLTTPTAFRSGTARAWPVRSAIGLPGPLVRQLLRERRHAVPDVRAKRGPGQLRAGRYAAVPVRATLNGPWTAEAFGDEGLVNGLVAPFFNVEPRLYRFRCLNGCNARILDLQMAGGLIRG